MSGLETNLKSTRPRPDHYETKTKTSAKGRDRDRDRDPKIGLETGLETFITAGNFSSG